MSNNAYMHQYTNNCVTLLLRQIESESTGAITPYGTSSNKPFFGVFPCHAGQLSCVLHLSMAPAASVIKTCCTFTSVRRVALLFRSIPDSTILSSSPHLPLMSHTHPTSTSSNFRLLFDNALKEYKKRTRNDLLTHPLADRLEACDSASRILTVLQEQVQELNESRGRNMVWLDLIVKVLHAFLMTLGECGGSVCLRT